ncbi:MAG: HAMP domain-containing sensor histidine kinase [Gammaproteobacteria bacterium]|nr:HAMP domain-containing sensor histidine kinase [Gammaproteobacteria bacterium]
MPLRTHILLWALLAAVVPLSVAGFVAVANLEQAYRREVADQLGANLRGALSAIERQLLREREMLLGLARARAVEAYLPILAASRASERPPGTAARTASLGRFLESFQQAVTTFQLVRVMDRDGITRVKVRGTQGVPAEFDGLGALPQVEEEVDDPAFLAWLRARPPGEVAYTILPSTRRGLEAPRRLTMRDAVVPLQLGDEVVGYLAATTWGLHVDRALERIPRLYGAELMLVELDAAVPGRHGQLLYDGASDLRMTDLEAAPRTLAESYPDAPWQALQAGGEGRLDDLPGDRAAWYHAEIHPYPDRLTSWLALARVDRPTLPARYVQSRTAVAVGGGLVLLAFLAIAHLGARRVAEPVSRLERTLAAYAEGDRARRASEAGPREIRRLARAFNRLADRLERTDRERAAAQQQLLGQARLASIGEMASGLAHEINNPLNNVLAYLKLVRRELPGEADGLRRDVDAAREEALRAATIIRGVLDFARQAPARIEPFAVAGWLAECAGAVADAARQRGVDVRLDDRADGARCAGDRGQLRQVLVNLLLNAVQASPDGATVDLMACVNDGWLEVRVGDRGSGLPEDDRERLFEPFYTTKPVGAGTGLGLAVALGLAEQNGGRLELGDRDGGGAEARLVLPLEEGSEA